MSGISGAGNLILDGLVLHLDAANPKSYVSGSTTWNDLSGNRNNGTLTNSPTFSTSNAGSILFDGVDDRINVPSLSNNNFPLLSGTISIWLKPTTFQGYYSIFDNFNGSVNNIFIRTYTNATPVFQIACQSSDGLYKYVFNYTSFLIGVWTNIVFTYKTGVSNFTNLYVNGTLVNSGTLSSTTFVPDGQTVGTTGQQHIGNYGSYMIYNRALSSTEVLQNYNVLKNRYI